MYDQLAKAVHKSIFLTSDPRLIVYQEAHRLVGDNNDPDFFLQKIRDSFRWGTPAYPFRSALP